MNYIILDLEWNQSSTGQEPEVATLPFEIIEIGAIKLNHERIMVSEFSQLIRPTVYHRMHRITSKLIHMRMEELERGSPSPRWWRTSCAGVERTISSVPGGPWT